MRHETVVRKRYVVKPSRLTPNRPGPDGETKVRIELILF